MEDIIQLGPTFLRSMMPFERMNGVIKGFVRNMSCPDGSIAQGYLTKECISFCESYLTKDRVVGLPVNKHCGRLEGEGHTNGHRDLNVLRSGRQNDIDRENLVVLQHLDVLEDFGTLHKETIAKKYRDRGVHRTDAEVIREHNSTFVC